MQFLAFVDPGRAKDYSDTNDRGVAALTCYNCDVMDPVGDCTAEYASWNGPPLPDDVVPCNSDGTCITDANSCNAYCGSDGICVPGDKPCAVEDDDKECRIMRNAFNLDIDPWDDDAPLYQTAADQLEKSEYAWNAILGVSSRSSIDGPLGFYFAWTEPTDPSPNIGGFASMYPHRNAVSATPLMSGLEIFMWLLGGFLTMFVIMMQGWGSTSKNVFFAGQVLGLFALLYTFVTFVYVTISLFIVTATLGSVTWGNDADMDQDRYYILKNIDILFGIGAWMWWALHFLLFLAAAAVVQRHE